MEKTFTQGSPRFTLSRSRTRSRTGLASPLKPRYPVSGSRAARAGLAGRHWSISATHRFLRRAKRN